MLQNKKNLIVIGIVFFILIIFLISRVTFAPNEQQLKFSGNIEVTEIGVSFEIPGRLIARKVSEGDKVQKGDLIALLDKQMLLQEVGLKKAELRAAKAELAELKDGYLPEEIAQAKAKLEQAEATYSRAESDYKRQKSLYEKEVISNKEFDYSSSAFFVAKAQVKEAKESLILLEKGFRKEKIDRSEANVTRASKDLELSQTRLGYATIVSPITGFVISENLESGEYAQAGTPVVTVADLSKVWLRGYIDELDLGKIKLGQDVFVTIDSYPNKEYHGKISFISSEAEFTPKNIQTEKERVKLVYRIKVNLSNSNLELKPGMPADGMIKFDQ